MNISAINLPDASTRVYQYGVRVDEVSRDLVRQQYLLAHQTFNEIIADIRRISKAALDWLQGMAGPEAASIRNQIDLLNERFLQAKAEDNRDVLITIAEERRHLWQEWYQMMHKARRENAAELAAQLKDIGERTSCRIYQIRCEAVQRGLGWATANAVLKAAIQAFRKQWPKFKQPNFRRIADIPRKTLELQFTTPGGIRVESILNRKCPEISIQPDPSKKYADFTFRIGAGASRQDIHGTVYYHRPLPKEGKVKYARMVEHRVGKDLKYYLQLVVTDIAAGTDCFDEERPLAALDFGWYFEDDGRRVAGFSPDGNPKSAEIIRLPPEIDALLLRSETFKAERDKSRDEIVAILKETVFSDEPEGIKEALMRIRRTQAQWVSASTLARLAFRWRTECSDYRPDILEQLENWRKVDKRRWQSESHLASRARWRRKKYYEALARHWTNQYGTIIIDSPDLSETAKVKDKTTGRHNKLGGVARGGRVKTALYELEQAIANAASKTGTQIMKIKGRTSKTCSLCGGTTTTRNDGDREVTCSSCGALVDREKNAAAVVWQRGMSQMGTIRQMYLDAKAKQGDKLQKRQMNKQVRQQARWGARTPSEPTSVAGFADKK